MSATIKNKIRDLYCETGLDAVDAYDKHAQDLVDRYMMDNAITHLPDGHLFWGLEGLELAISQRISKKHEPILYRVAVAGEQVLGTNYLEILAQRYPQWVEVLEGGGYSMKTTALGKINTAEELTLWGEALVNVLHDLRIKGDYRL